MDVMHESGDSHLSDPPAGRSPAPYLSRLADPRIHILVLLVLSLIIIGYNLGASSFHNVDEAKHAVVAREIVDSGEWLTPTYRGKDYFKKPPLRIWLTALTFRATGPSELAARFWSAVFGIGTVLGLYVLCRPLFGVRVAFVGAFVLLTSHQYIYNHCVRTGETDAMLIFFWCCGLLLLQLSVHRRSSRLLYLAGVCIGLCGMVKHLTFVPGLLFIAGLWLLVTGGWRAFRWQTWLLGLAIVAVAALPWHLAQWWMHGDRFLSTYFFTEVVEGRLASSRPDRLMALYGHGASLVTFAHGFFPWSCLLPLALVDLLAPPGDRRRWWLQVIWLAFAVGLTVVSARKFTWYVLPAFPAAAILTARLVDRFLVAPRAAFARFAVLLGALIVFTSTTDAAIHNPFDVRAGASMVSVDFLGRLDFAGVPPSVTLFLLALVAALPLAVRRYRHGSLVPRVSRRWPRQALVTALAVLALYNVSAPLRFSASTSALHRLALALPSHIQEDESLLLAIPPKRFPRSFSLWYLGPFKPRRVDPSATAGSPASGSLVLTTERSLERLQQRDPDTRWRSMSPLEREEDLVLIRDSPGL